MTAGPEAVVRIPIRARPGASRTRVGGRHDERLVVAVSARAVDGAATEAALAAVAGALGVRRREVTLVTGRTSRDKVVEVARFDGLDELLGELLDTV
ncbi:MAG: DUF167 domain-containing protein [Brevundimonas sp.]